MKEIREALEFYADEENWPDDFSYFSYHEKAQQSLAHLDKLEADAGELTHYIKTWSEAYPLDIFPEPDMKKARELLEAGGLTLDAVSASSMRHVITRLTEFIDRQALNKEG